MAMTALSVRDLDPEVKARLRIRAAEHGRSMEAEVRAILTDAVSEPAPPQSLADAIRAVALRHGGVDLERPKRRSQRPVELG
jgi:plasmid stability protein